MHYVREMLENGKAKMSLDSIGMTQYFCIRPVMDPGF